MLIIDLTQDSDEEDEIVPTSRFQRASNYHEPVAAPAEPELGLLPRLPISILKAQDSTYACSLQQNLPTTESSTSSRKPLGAITSLTDEPTSGTSAAEPVPYTLSPEPTPNGVDTTQIISNLPLPPSITAHFSSSPEKYLATSQNQTQKQLPRPNSEFIKNLKARIKQKHDAEKESQRYATREPLQRKRSKKPLCKPKSRYKRDGKPLPKRVKALDVYDDFGDTDGKASVSCRPLPPLYGLYNYELSIKDALDLETDSKAFDDAFASVVNKVPTNMAREQLRVS